MENVAAMAELVRRTRVKSEVRISLEVEKLGRVYDDILPHVDVVFVSKEFSISKGNLELLFADRFESKANISWDET